MSEYELTLTKNKLGGLDPTIQVNGRMHNVWRSFDKYVQKVALSLSVTVNTQRVACPIILYTTYAKHHGVKLAESAIQIASQFYNTDVTSNLWTDMEMLEQAIDGLSDYTPDWMVMKCSFAHLIGCGMSLPEWEGVNFVSIGSDGMFILGCNEWTLPATNPITDKCWDLRNDEVLINIVETDTWYALTINGKTTNVPVGVYHVIRDVMAERHPSYIIDLCNDTDGEKIYDICVSTANAHRLASVIRLKRAE